MKKLLAPLGAAAAGIAILASTGAANAATTFPKTTCTQQQTFYNGMYRVDNDIFAGDNQRTCISSTNGQNLYIHNNYRPAGNKVVAYPDIRVGRFYGSLDHEASRFVPQRVRNLRNVELHDWAVNNAPGHWQADNDVWMHNDQLGRGHGTAELVIVNRASSRGASGVPMNIDGMRFYESHWPTTDGSGHYWPLIYLKLAQPRDHMTLNLHDVMRHVGGLVGESRWVTSIAYGVECWSGGKGLRVHLGVNN